DRFVYLIPAALGGSPLAPSDGEGWTAGLGSTDRETLFGSAAYRGLVSAGLAEMPADATPSEYDAEGGPVNAVFWYQGETDSRFPDRRTHFTSRTAQVFDAFEIQLGTLAGAPVI